MSPKVEYLSKREDNTYCIINSCGMPVNNYTTKNICFDIANKFNIKLSDLIWCAKSGKFKKDL